MILDALAVFADAQTGTTSAASTDIIDMLESGDSIERARMFIRVDTAFTALNGAPTNEFQIQTADNSDFISGAPVTLIQTAALLAADLAAGAVVMNVEIPPGLKRYLRVYKKATTASAGNVFWSAGAYDAFIVADSDSRRKVLA